MTIGEITKSSRENRSFSISWYGMWCPSAQITVEEAALVQGLDIEEISKIKQ